MSFFDVFRSGGSCDGIPGDRAVGGSDHLDSCYYYYRKVGHSILIEIRLDSIDRIHDPLDPSRYPERTLDRGVESYITDAVRDFPKKTELELVVYVPEKEMQKEGTKRLVQTIHNHFRYKAAQARREMREIFESGRTGLMGGILLLALVLFVNLTIARTPDSVVNEVLRNSLLVIGWVAMWQPISAFLYEWRPYQRKLKIYRKICRMKISIIPLETRVEQERGPGNDPAVQ